MSLEAALAYHRRGWSVFPVRCRDKVPLVEWKPYQTERAHEDQIVVWWTEWPDANIGVATGRLSGLLVVDIDNADGHAAAKTLGLDAIVTWRSATGRGEHVFFAYPT